jgi:transcriptional regulator with XRE-family HTH domain
LDIYLGQTARNLRESLGLTQRAAATALGISFVHLCNIEKNRAVPSQTLIDKFRELWGVDLYVLAWCTLGDSSKLPKPLRKAASELEKGWKEHVKTLIEKHRQSADR